jgi:hypothetical protein
MKKMRKGEKKNSVQKRAFKVVPLEDAAMQGRLKETDCAVSICKALR